MSCKLICLLKKYMSKLWLKMVLGVQLIIRCIYLQGKHVASLYIQAGWLNVKKYATQSIWLHGNVMATNNFMQMRMPNATSAVINLINYIASIRLNDLIDYQRSRCEAARRYAATSPITRLRNQMINYIRYAAATADDSFACTRRGVFLKCHVCKCTTLKQRRDNVLCANI